MELYYIKRTVFESDNNISEIIYVTKEIRTPTHATPEILCSSIKETPINNASKELIESVSDETKQYISKEQAYSLVRRFKNEGAFTL
ncbi:MULTISPECIES: hypothetical protein [Cytobacillus]|uniref:hypothetical protein n=1 Tax=Cytobacillus TaxID=2675230 RepID=UPI002040F483|nr:MULTISPECIES: hypothetical protein [Cytobacillus]MCM3394873.1 hypothetical protein [Cytobacillus oceanisediminis]UQX56046.1 hypothetical protein M5V91_10690 [Cytobacillus pseudoceanisediminis]